MNDAELKEAYKKMFDDVHASDELRGRVINLKHRNRVITPFKATIGTIAAAVMIFAAVNEYGFVENTDGVISQTTVSTQTPQAEISAVKPEATTAPQKPKTTKKPVAVKKTDAVAVLPVAQTPEPSSAPVVAEHAPAEAEADIAAYTAEGEMASYGGRAIVGNDADNTTEIWEINRYYNYIGTDIGSSINASYTGPQSFELDTGADGTPVEDMLSLTYLSANGGNIRITVSKSAYFDSQLSGTVIESGNGYNAYKVSSGVYYQIYTTGMSLDEVQTIVSGL